jgi:transposase-like protein
MELAERWCDNTTCPDYGKVGAGNLKAFSHVERRYYCATCRRTSRADKHTFFETIRCRRATVLEALALLCERNSLRAVARLTHHSPNRVLHWLALAGQHGAAVSAAMIRGLPLTHVQIDELWTFVKKSKPTAARGTLRMSATLGSGVPWRCPAGCAWSATSAMTEANRRRGRFSRDSRPEPMAGRPSSPRNQLPAYVTALIANYSTPEPPPGPTWPGSPAQRAVSPGGPGSAIRPGPEAT